MDIKTLISKVKENKDLREAIVFCFSTLVTLGFAISNRVLGAVNKSIWHETIGLYYLLLLAIKIIIILTQKDNKKRTFEKIERNNKIIFYITGSILFLVNIALSGPIILMIMDKRIIQFGLIESIAIAAFTTFKVYMAIRNYIKNKNNSDIIVKEVKVVSLVEAIVSILTLQNTLIAVNASPEEAGDLKILTIVSSIVGLLAILYFIVDMFIKFVNKIKKSKKI
ncbi:MAG: hypothetical protein E7177_01600 [Erysipelotrichaceae bacterium]|nr:hypothetical protein [Erysipelotrichaceae bacterium]